MRIAIIGAGQIAEAHLTELAKIPDVQVVGLCDLYETPLVALSDKYHIPRTFTDAKTMVSEVRPDVVHVTTPPGSHAALGRMLIDAGCNIHMEKPFTITHAETEELIGLAEKKGVKLCINTNRVCSLEYIEALSHIRAGDVGNIAHMDVVFSYNLKGPFGKQVTSNPNHWIARLPGQIVQNNLSHCLSFVVPHLGDDLDVSVWSADFSGNGIVQDELRLLIVDKTGKRTASVTFSCGIGPVTFTLRVFGTRRNITVDNINHTFAIDENPSLPGNLGLIFKVREQSNALRKQFHGAMRDFFTGRENYFSDMNRLFKGFYDSISSGSEPPITHREIWRSSLLMERTIQGMRKEVA